MIGLLFAVYLYGARVIDPRSVDWLMGESDPLQHFLGWDFFRRDVWRFPLGRNPTFGTLADSSIVYSDSSPLLGALAQVPPFAWMAARRGLSINTAPYARMSARSLQERASTELQYVRAGQLDPATVYVLAEERLVEDTCALDGVHCHRLSTGVAVAVASGE